MFNWFKKKEENSIEIEIAGINPQTENEFLFYNFVEKEYTPYLEKWYQKAKAQGVPFKIQYDAKIDYVEGGKAITYAGAGRLKKIWLSFQREIRRKRWFNSAYEKICEGKYDSLIIPTATYRYLRTLEHTLLKESPVPIYIFSP